MEAGKMTKLTVDRVSDIGYILSNGNKEDEVLLHFNECNGKELNVGENINVFIFFDHKKRLAATLHVPIITVFDCDWIEVVDVVYFGVFVNIGIRKDILLSSDDLPLNKELWPKVGDKIYAYLINDNDKGLLIKLATRNDFLDIFQEAPKDVYGKKLDVRVVKIGSVGINVISEEGYMGFIHNSEYKDEPRLGSLVNARVINVKSNHEINLSLIPQKELAIKDDSATILDYLNSHYGKMPLCDISSPEDIKSLLDISKSAFKRAMGKLLKEEIITQDLDKKITSLIE